MKHFLTQNITFIDSKYQHETPKASLENIKKILRKDLIRNTRHNKIFMFIIRKLWWDEPVILDTFDGLDQVLGTSLGQVLDTSFIDIPVSKRFAWQRVRAQISSSLVSGYHWLIRYITQKVHLKTDFFHASQVGWYALNNSGPLVLKELFFCLLHPLSLFISNKWQNLDPSFLNVWGYIFIDALNHVF